MFFASHNSVVRALVVFKVIDICFLVVEGVLDKKSADSWYPLAVALCKHSKLEGLINGFKTGYRSSARLRNLEPLP